MGRGWISTAAVLVVVGALTAAPIAGHAEETPAPDRVVTLPTGERVVLAPGPGGRAVRSVQPAPGTVLGPASEPARVRTMAVGSHFYVVPDEALPYVGRQLDLALFDVSAPVAGLQVQWAPGASVHAVPGLELKPAVAGRSAARIGDPAAFGVALARAARAARAARSAVSAATGPLAGIQALHAVASPPPTASPQFPLATLTVRGLDTRGAPAFSGSVTVTNAEDVQRFSSLQSFVDGQLSFSVPVGHYSIEVSITTYDAGNRYLGDALLFFPQIDITENGTVVTADASTARTVVPIPATPDPSTLEQLQATYSRVSAAGYDSTTAFMLIGGSPELSVTPTAPVSIGEVHWYTYFRLNSPAGAATPYLYDLVFPSDTGVPAQFPGAVPARDLAVVDASYAAEAGPATINTSRASFQYWEKFPIRFASTAVAPLRRTEYVAAVPDVGWIGTALASPQDGNGLAQTPMTAYAAGAHAVDDYLMAPAVPGVDRGTVRPVPCPICRQGDQLLLNLQPWTDAGGHAVQFATTDTTTATVHGRVYADGAPIADGTGPTGAVTIPASAKQLRLELDTAVSAPWRTTAGRVATAWTWNTAAPSGPLPDGRTCARPDQPCAFQPLLFAEYAAAVDTTDAVPAGVATPLTVVVRHQAYDPAPAADHLTLEVSGDDGATWTAVTAGATGEGRFTATVTPAAGFLSLRIHATDPLGGTLDQTVLRALRVAG
ncbi:hypothetical protein [Actinoplanes subtropicus]|uniref:hypothetical protein n=1 Tax=Actinoplanes subtropicus TaxID=543632 RepID=UPI0004C42094|nr:hypothetical protein [Actinoplanes subtropicus]